MNDIYIELMKPFPINRTKFRVGATNKDKTKGIALAYIDSRDVMDRLDTVLGFENWQCRYPEKGTCELSIKIKGEWITKTNCAGETAIEGEKGEASDSFKRSAVLFGVGRYLYYMENVWCPLDSYRKIINPPEKELKELIYKWETKKLGTLKEEKNQKLTAEEIDRKIENLRLKEL